MINPADNEINIFLPAATLLFLIIGLLILAAFVFAIGLIFKHFDRRMKAKLQKYKPIADEKY